MAQPGTPSFINLAIKGLFLNPSTFGNNAPDGALTTADNVVIDRPSVVETRRGFDNTFASITDGVDSMFQYAGTMVIHTGGNQIQIDEANDGVFVPRTGTYSVPNPADPASRIRAIEANKNLYYITENGTYRLDSPLNLTPRLAGAPAGLSGTAATSGTVGFLPDQTNVAYRVVFGYRDANSQIVLGAPSSRILLSNATGTDTNATVTFQQPLEIRTSSTDWFFQLYRGNASADLATPPDDEMALVFEGECDGNPTITVTDVTPDNLKGAALYTNQGQEGILQSNFRPPWASDLCLFKGYTFYANTRNVHVLFATLISAGALNGTDALIPGDTITFTDPETGYSFFITGTAGANNGTLGLFNVSNTGNPAFDIQTTADNIALVMNSFPDNTFLTAYSTSTDSDLPGKLRFDRITLTAVAVTMNSSRNTCWQQPLPITSVNDARANRIYYSKFNQPEAVPVINYFEVGSANQPINRIVPLRDGVMVLKQDGIFRVSNAAPPFNIQPIDFNVRILAPNTAAELDNKVYFLSDQGVIALSDSDAEIKSFVLDRTIIENTSPTLFPNLQAVAWGIAYQSDRKYILFMPQTAGETQASQQYVYNHLTEVWTRWTLKASCGLVFRRDGKLYLGGNSGSAPGVNQGNIFQERKTFTAQDFVDDEYVTANTTAGSLTTIVVANPLLPAGEFVLPGWTVEQPATGSRARVVTATPGVSFTTLVLDREQLWDLTDVTLYQPVYSEVETIQMDCQNPGMNKQFTEIVYIFTEQGFTQLAVEYTTDTAIFPAKDIILPNRRGGWGIDPWGLTPWGTGTSGQGKVRRYIPQAVQRAGWIYLNIKNAEAFTRFGWSGAQLFYKNTSSRQK
jgi:hypothetical protein